MLFLMFAPGDYLTIGDNVVIQVSKVEGNRCKLAIHAPREVPVLRGKVLERTGEERPDCVLDASRLSKPEAAWRKKRITWNRSKEQALAAMRLMLSQMDGRDDGVKALRRQLNYIFPPEQTKTAEQTNEVSPG